MISCELMGGFGNQLFQIAALTGLSCKHDEPAKYPKWENSKYFGFEKFFNYGVDFNNLFEHNQKDFHYYERPFQAGTLYKGYYQSSKFFEGFDDVIKADFSLKKEYEVYPRENSCSIHVRRGDYLTLQQFHPVQTMRYFNQAINIVKTMTNDDIYFYVFSDDMPWCKENFKVDNLTFVEGQDMIYDFSMMKNCNHHIISNSSFSWWTSYLSNPGLVVAPARWFGPALSHETKHIYEKDWIQL